MMARLQEHSANDLEMKIYEDKDSTKLNEILTVSSQEDESMPQIVVTNYGSSLHQHGSNFIEEQAGSDLQEGFRGADFSIYSESLAQTVTGNHASSIHQYGSNSRAVRAPARAAKPYYRLTLDFFSEIITILFLCCPDLLMMLMYGLEEGWNYGSLFLPVIYIVFLFMLYKKENFFEISSSTRSCNSNHKPQLQIEVDRLDFKMKKRAMAFYFVIIVVLLLYSCFKGPSAMEDGGNNDGHMTMAEHLREVERIIIKKQGGGATSRFIAYFSVVLVSIRGGLPTGVLISILCAKKKMELAGHRIFNLEACATIGCIDTVCICTSKTGDLTLKKEEIADLRQDDGIDIKIVVGDDLYTGRFIAINSGIIQPEENNLVVDAAELRNLSDEERENMVANTRLMVNSTPFDKLLMVQDLKRKCKKVAVASNSTRDFLSLKEAVVGLFVDNGTAQVPHEGTDIVLSDNSLTAIADVLKQGRFSFNNIQKFIQLHLTITMAGNIMNFFAVISARKIFLSQFQIWWVSLMGETLGAFALSTDPPSLSLSSLGASSLTNKTIWRNILFQALYQTTMSLALHFIAIAILHVDETKVCAMIFNSYALCQVFALLNAKEIEKKNVFENMHKNLWFLLWVLFMVVLQVTFTCFNPKLSLDPLKWSICIGISALSLPIGWVVKYIPVPASA